MPHLLPPDVATSALTVDIDDLLDRSHVVSLPLRVRFRGITTRHVMLIDGPCGWGEFAPFIEYAPEEAAWWLASALESAYVGLPAPAAARVAVNATIPAVPPQQVPKIMARYPGCSTIKIKVADTGHSLADDIARINAVRETNPQAALRIDANRGYTVEQAFHVISHCAPLDYAEQPCATIAELKQLRAKLRAHDIPARVAADESIRRAEDPLAIAAADAVDAAVLKVAPIGGVGRIGNLIARLPMDITIASALDSAVGMNAGLYAAAQHTTAAAGLATQQLFLEDVAAPRPIIDGTMSTAPVAPEPERLAELAATPDTRHWWQEHLRQSLQALRLRLQS